VRSSNLVIAIDAGNHVEHGALKHHRALGTTLLSNLENVDMMQILAGLLLAAAVTAEAGMARADEAAFLQSLEGKWAGKGAVRVRTNSPPITVSCWFDSSTTASSLTLDGICRGLIVISRTVGVNLKSNGGKYTGSYIGAGTGVAGLTGSRQGNAIHLGIRWAKNVNGDRSAQITVQKVGDSGMMLTTTDVDPQSGKSVVTSEINLLRN
jgi:hypothetical protein